MTPHPFRILFVIGSLEIGGAEKQVLSLARYLQQHSCTCHLFTLESGGPLLPRFRALNVPVTSAGFKRGDLHKSPWKLLMAERRLWRCIKQTKPDVLHAFLPLVTFMGAISGKWARIPLVITSRRALGTHQERYFFLKPLDRVANRFSDYILVNSQAVWNDTCKRDHADPVKLRLIHNGLDPTPFEAALGLRIQTRKQLGIGPDTLIIIMIGNLIPYKGHKDFFEAARRVIDQLPDTVILVVGEDRGILEDLKSQVLRLGISHQVRFLGQRNDIPELLGASDISVLASHEEGFSNVILESMAAGLPVVATRVGGNPEAVVEGETGWLIPAQDSSALASKILDFVQNPQRRRKWGRAGQKRVKDLFSEQQMAEAHLKLYATARH